MTTVTAIAAAVIAMAATAVEIIAGIERHYDLGIRVPPSPWAVAIRATAPPPNGRMSLGMLAVATSALSLRCKLSGGYPAAVPRQND
jgi:hypothetical protein